MSDLVPLPNPVPYGERCILCREKKALKLGTCGDCKRNLIVPHARDWGLTLEEALEDFLTNKDLRKIRDKQVDDDVKVYLRKVKR